MRDIAAIKYITNENARKIGNEKTSVEFVGKEVVEKVRNFHKSFPEYKVTPLQSLNELSEKLGVDNIWIKDESYRFGLNAFKVLGGSFAGSVQGYLASVFGKDRPITAIVEPNEAACIYKSVKENDGKPHAVTGDMLTIMAGLACGEPSTVAWGVLRDYADMYISCPDYVTARGMRILGNPLIGDPKVISGESGAVGLGILSLILEENNLKEIAEKLNINKDSKILIISTEGDTDPEGYRKIVWDGMYKSV